MVWRAAILALAICAAAPAWAIEGGALEIVSLPGVAVRTPAVDAGERELRLSGVVCRGGFSAGRPRFVRLERVNEFGAVVQTSWSNVRSSPGYRGGCGAYTVRTGALGVGERARLSIHRSRQTAPNWQSAGAASRIAATCCVRKLTVN